MNAVLLALAGLGAVVAIRLLQSALDFLSFHLLPGSLGSLTVKRYQRPGNAAWALVTGASAGIGLGIAQELVRQGFGVVLLGHLQDELEQAAAQLRAMRPDDELTKHQDGRVRTVVLDARTATPSDLEKLADTLRPLNLTILVNNVGGNPIAHPTFRHHATYSCADVDAVIDQNARFMARLTALLIPLLARVKPGTQPTQNQNRSLILSIGVPYRVMYSATKGFNRAFGAALARELALDPATAHVDSLVVIPGEVRSQGNCRGLPSNAPRWDVFGRDIVRKAGVAAAREWREMFPHWRHALEYALLEIAPRAAVEKGLVEQLTAKKQAWDEYLQKNQKRKMVKH
jgi:17beta-estradiol 17-dehydrogenase / very-long-chain 3-oxoacyl-CoA reductase